jgi:hypothetical protein
MVETPETGESMKQILKLLARLYPAEWRRRYGAEYEALLEAHEPRVRDAFDVLWSAMKMQATSLEFCAGGDAVCVGRDTLCYRDVYRDTSALRFSNGGDGQVTF